MTGALIVEAAGPGVTIQDDGRPGFLSYGLSRGGAADRLALIEGAALLGNPPQAAAVEMAGMGGTFSVTQDTRIALTGAPMKANVDGEMVTWNSSLLLPSGAKLSIGAVREGVYGYLSVGGGIANPEQLGARSAHLSAGIGALLKPGDELPLGTDGRSDVGFKLDVASRADGGTIRVVPGLQTDFFEKSEIARFQATVFERDARGNRMGVRMVPDGEGFHTQAGLNILSEVIVPGDIQITGDGTPYVLMCECGTTGGYPRIGSVLPSDLPRVAQAAPGTRLQFRFLSLEEAVEIERKEAERRRGLRGMIFPLIRDPHTMTDLLSYQLVGGVTAGDDLERADPA